MTDAAPRDPWERLGWVMGAVWVLFLVFPLASASTADVPWVWRALAAAGILAFGVVYLHGLVRNARTRDRGRMARQAWTYLAVMVALQAGSGLVIGADAVYLLPFVMSFATFALPLRTGLVVSAAGVVASVVVPWLLGELRPMLGFVPIVVLVAVITAVIRAINERQAEHRALTDDLALVAERERVARDVHDVLGHSLTVVSVKAELAERLLEADPARARAELVDIQSLTRQALAEVRATVAGLRVARLGDELAAAGAALEGAGIEADLPTDPAVVDPRHRIVLAWVLREAVTNVVRHSGARRCRVELGEDSLRVVDDGRGLGGSPDGNGLSGARERVAAVGGTLTTLPGPDGRGTAVEVQL